MAAAVGATRDPYVGERKKQLREGFGVYVYENKFFRYEGEWKNGKKHGDGKFTMADGSYYEGEFSGGEIEGHGLRFCALNGNTYSGQFHQGEFHGQGVMKYGSGGTYEGDWHRNVRQGYGKFRCSDNSVYQGYLYNNHRHGEGTQVYSNGDRYDGDWVNDKRQGHGELRKQDGSIYDGQWHNDFYNGQGALSHSSGMVYEGLWINGKPALMATKLVIKNEGPLEVLQGIPFRIEIECQNSEGQLVEDEGRELMLSAGFKFITPPKKELPSSKENSSTSLFDMIEEMEEKPISTPFGYDVISYPITDQFPYEENDEALLALGSRSTTALSEVQVNDDGATNKELEKAKEEEVKDVDTAEEGKVVEAPGCTDSSATEDANTMSDPNEPTAGVASEDQIGGQNVPDDPVTVVPPVSTLRTTQGIITFDNLVLSSAPPMYRPFLVDDHDRLKPSKSRQAKRPEGDVKAEDTNRPATRSKSREKSVGDERFARAASRTDSNKKRKSKKGAPAAVESKPVVEEELAVDDKDEDLPEDSDLENEVAQVSSRFAPAGEYVIMVHDVTNPPFIEHQLEPAFIKVKVIIPKRPKVKKPKEKNDDSTDLE